MFTGEYRHSVDSKNRLFIPAKHREELGASFMIVRDIRSPRLKVYSMEGWEAYIAPIRAKDRRLAENVLRFLHKDAVVGEPDAQGRVTLNPELLKYAGIDPKSNKDVVIVGCADFAEIWAADRYDEEMAKEDPAALCAELEALGL